MARWVGAQGRINSAKKSLKHGPIMTSPTEPKTQNKKHFFPSQLEDLPNS